MANAAEVNNDYYRLFFKGAKVAMLLINPSDGKIVDANGAAESFYGYSLRQLREMNISQINTLTKEEIKIELFNALSQNKSFFNFPHRLATGEVRDVEVHSGIINLSGQSLLYSIVHDVTDRKLIEKTLREREESYFNLFENMLDGLAQCQMLYANGIPHDFIYLNVNKQFERLTGLKNVIGKKVSEVIPGILDSNPELLEIYGRVALTGKPEKFETYLEALGLWFSITVYSNAKEEFIAVFQEITEHKRTEQELIVLNNHLTQEVNKRTTDLAELTAHIQNVTEEERARLARNLHDEMGSTMVGISMEVGRLKGKISDPALLQDLSLIKDLLAKAIQIKREVVSQLYPTILENYGLINAVEYLIKEFGNRSGISVEMVMPKEEVLIDNSFAVAAYRITQECLTNIAKHAEASKVLIEAKAKDGYLDLTITDNGKGLSGRTNTGGYGIFGMIERARYLGGSMNIGSEGDTGTTAHLRLPLSEPKPKNKKRVLVVDDHAIVRDAIKNLLEREAADFSVEGEAADGNVAIQMAIEEIWDIILLDICLPKVNGIQVLETIMAVKPKQPIIMLSSSPEEEYGEIARSKGAAFYIEKGETGKLVEAMRRATQLQ